MAKISNIDSYPTICFDKWQCHFITPSINRTFHSLTNLVRLSDCDNPIGIVSRSHLNKSNILVLLSSKTHVRALKHVKQ